MQYAANRSRAVGLITWGNIGATSLDAGCRLAVATIGYAIVALSGLTWLLRPRMATISPPEAHLLYLWSPFLLCLVLGTQLAVIYLPTADPRRRRQILDKLMYWSIIITVGAVIWFGALRRSGPGFAETVLGAVAIQIVYRWITGAEFVAGIALIMATAMLADQPDRVVWTIGLPGTVSIVAGVIDRRLPDRRRPWVLMIMQVVLVGSGLWFYGRDPALAIIGTLLTSVVVGVIALHRVHAPLQLLRVVFGVDASTAVIGTALKVGTARSLLLIKYLKNLIARKFLQKDFQKIHKFIISIILYISLYSILFGLELCRKISRGVLIVGLLCGMLAINTIIPIDPYHQGFVVMPVHDLINGRSLLVDINAQYGVGINYFLGALFLWQAEWISFHALSVVTNLTECVGFAVILIVAWRLTGRSVATVLIVGLGTALYRFANASNPSSVPSAGFFRFGLGWLVVLVLTSRIVRRRPSLFIGSVGFFAGVASIYSLEVGIYVVALLIGATILEAWRRHGDVRGFVVRVVASTGVGILTAHLLLAGDVYRRAGVWPDWRHYTQFLTVYDAGLGFVAADVRSLWFPLFLCYAGSVMWGVIERLRHRATSKRAAVTVDTVILVAGYGLLQFSYFAFRSHPNNLLHIMFPAVVLVAWWWHRLTPAVVAQWPLTMTPVLGGVLVVLGIFGARSVTLIGGAYGSTGLGWVIDEVRMLGVTTRPPLRDRIRAAMYPDLGATVAETRRLIDRYAQPDGSIVLLIEADLNTVARLGTRTLNALPLSYQLQDWLVPVGREAAFGAVRYLPYGTMVLVGEGELIDDVATELAMVLCDRGQLTVVEATTRVQAVRLDRRGSSEGTDWCPTDGRR